MVYTDPDEVPWSAYLTVAAVMAVIVAALLPWYATGPETTNGLTHSDGYVTAGVALAALGLLLAFEWEIVAQVGAALAGFVSIWAGYGTWTQVGSNAGQSPEAGVYLTLLAGAVLVAAAVYGAAETYLLRGADGDGDAATRTVE
jgi:hypothetical protein